MYSGATTGGNGGSRLRAPLERGRRVQTAMFFFLFCLITKFCYVLWLPMALHSIHFAQYALWVDEFNSECSPVSESSVIEIDLFCVFPVYTNFLCSLFVARYHYFEVLCTCLRLLFKGWITMFHDISSV